MRKWGAKLVGVAMLAGIVGGMTPAASASETQVPCETIFGEYLCAQINATGDFVDQTVANAVGAVEEWRDRVAAAGEDVTDLVWCIVSGACPITIAIDPLQP